MNGQPTGRATRPAFLTAVSAVAVAAGLPAAAAATPSPGPIAKLAAERRAIVKAVDNHQGSEAEAQLMMGRWSELGEGLAVAHAETPAEALALLQEARDDLWQFHFEDDNPDLGERLVLSALDNALRVFGAAVAVPTGSVA